MAGQDDAESTEQVAVTGSQAAWVTERAETLGYEPAEYLERVLVSVRAVESGDPLADIATDEDLAALRERVDDLDDDVDAMIQDVRERVIQVKREADAKAPADHDHPDLAGELAEATERADAAATRVEAIAETVADVERRLDTGFENYEEILSYLVDRTDDLADHTETLATALARMRGQLATVVAHDQRRERTERLQRRANEEGVTAATCEACDSEVHVSLLAGPECPFCGATFADVEAKRGFFGSATLLTGSTPALEESTEETDEGVEDLEAVIAEEAAETDPSEWLEKIDSVVDVEESRQTVSAGEDADE
ncbi:MAG: hypothetical protein ABEJ59_05705 [Halanaeroarchaeum sp.]